LRAVDESRQHAAANWTAHTLKVLESNAAILSWWSYSTPLWYAQRVQGQRPDVAIIDDRTRLDENLGEARRWARSPVAGRSVSIRS
jgi:hypothetical protein